MLMILIRPSLFHVALRPAFRSSGGAASSRWSHSIGLPCTGAPRNNTVDQSEAIPVNLVEERNDEAMKAEGRQVPRRAQDADHGGGGVSVIGNRRGADLAKDILGFTSINEQCNFHQNQIFDQARRLDALEWSQAVLARSQAFLAWSQAVLARSQAALAQSQAILAQSQAVLAQSQADLARSQSDAARRLAALE